MKHIHHIKEVLKSGDSRSAYDLLDNLLSLAPRNPEALRLKAKILDHWGRFDESLRVMHEMLKNKILNEDATLDLEKRHVEDKLALVYTDITPEGKVFYPFPGFQIWVSLLGVLGCVLFLFLKPTEALSEEAFENMGKWVALFGVLVIFPWMLLVLTHFRGIKRVIVGPHSLKIIRGLKEKEIPWRDVGCLVVEYHNNPQLDHLKLQIFKSRENFEIWESLDISQKKSAIKARRHFLRALSAHVGVVLHVDVANRKPKPTEGSEELVKDSVVDKSA